MNMEKTIEEKDAAVLAELSRLSELHAVQAPEWPEWKAFKWREDYFTISRGEDQERVRLDYLGATCERGFHPEITNQFYRLLGLDVRDAVAELQSKIDLLEAIRESQASMIGRLAPENRGLQAKSAKLVEALESLKRNRTLDRFMIETFIDQALEAHKKGGNND